MTRSFGMRKTTSRIAPKRTSIETRKCNARKQRGQAPFLKAPFCAPRQQKVANNKGARPFPSSCPHSFLYQTDDLAMTREQSEKAAERLVTILQATYPQALHQMQA